MVRIVAAVLESAAESGVQFISGIIFLPIGFLHIGPPHIGGRPLDAATESAAPAVPKRGPTFKPGNLREIHGPGSRAFFYQPEALRQKRQQQARRQHLGPAKSLVSEESAHE